MLRYGFFDSEITGYDGENMPIFDRAESSDFLAAFIAKIITNGVLAEPGDCFKVMAGEGLNLKVCPGFAIIMGRFAMDTEEATVTVEKGPTSGKRIDRIVLRINYASRNCEIAVKKGTSAQSPQPPELLQPEAGDYYELGLATVLVNTNQTSIPQSNITDTRYDSRVCGVVTQAIDHLDTSSFSQDLTKLYESFTQSMEEFQGGATEQFSTWMATLEEQLSGEVATNLQNEINTLKGAVSNYFVCDTDGATANKAILISEGWKENDGAEICVKFKNTNTAENPTLTVVYKVNQANIYYKNAAIKAKDLQGGVIYYFRYDKANNRFDIVGFIPEPKKHGIFYTTSSPNNFDTFIYSTFTSDEIAAMETGDLILSSDKRLYMIKGKGSSGINVELLFYI